ncbi:MAG: DUF1565 domain-containing protein, partial [Candidatus Cloacimonetes bacterium]|nr:DUF1565 domain-containing protein [Candidatus Cloacimonadota bacterium]
TNCGIYGFTIQNGSGYPALYSYGVMLTYGGGFFLKDTQSFSIANCIIEGNMAHKGGGISIMQGTTIVSNTIVTQNFAQGGGGIFLSNSGQMIFDQTNRCSVFNNTAAIVQDIWGAGTRLDTYIYLDKASVFPPTDYYIYCNESIPIYYGSFPVIDVLRGERIESNHDFYVSTSGSDNNDGLSPTTPIKSIHKAMQLIASDEQNPKIIHLAGGTYSSNDGYFFPIGIKHYVSVIGDSVDVPILENLHYYNTISGSKFGPTTFNNLVLRSGSNPAMGFQISVGHTSYLKLENIIIEPYNAVGQAGIMLGSNNYFPFTCIMKNVHVQGQSSRYYGTVVLNLVNADVDIDNLNIVDCQNTAGEIESPLAIFYSLSNKFRMKNSRIVNTSISYNEASTFIVGFWGDQATRELKLDNVLVANNQTGGAPPVFIANFSDNPGIINNCTFANNSGANHAVQLNGNFEVNNCIFDNNTAGEIKSAGSTSQLQFNNNFIRNYPGSTSFEAFNNVQFNDVVLSGDPGFCSSIAGDPLSYRLGNSSICRDMGTPDTAGLALPDTDLAGNPRIYGTAIDIGCYEWNYPVSAEDELAPPAIQLSTFPNPFSNQLTLLFNLKQRGRLSCEFYNVKGQKVRNLADAPYNSGDHMLIWDGRDNSGQRLGSGIYFMKIQLDGKAIATRKMILAN